MDEARPGREAPALHPAPDRARQGRASTFALRNRPPEGRGPPNRHGMPKLPVGQHEVKNWPVLDLGEQPDVPIERVEARGRRPRRESVHADLGAVPGAAAGRRRQRLSLRDDVEPVRQPLARRAVQDDRRAGRADRRRPLRARAPATTSCPARYIPYTTNLPLARAIEDDVLLVHTWEGEPLPREHGGPCRMITPKLYAWKGAKWIRKIEFLAEDRKGFWEVRGYSNTAEPWFNDRYATE